MCTLDSAGVVLFSLGDLDRGRSESAAEANDLALDGNSYNGRASSFSFFISRSIFAEDGRVTVRPGREGARTGLKSPDRTSSICCRCKGVVDRECDRMKS